MMGNRLRKEREGFMPFIVLLGTEGSCVDIQSQSYLTIVRYGKISLALVFMIYKPKRH